MNDFVVDLPHYLPDLASRDYGFRSVDGLSLVVEYLRYETGGIAYLEYVQSPENLTHPNSLTSNNFYFARRIHARSLSDQLEKRLVGRHWAGLAEVPLDADLLMTDAWDELIIEILLEFSLGYAGINIANATKLLHQKRPGLVPILDSLVRQAAGVYEIGRFKNRADNTAVFQLGFKRFRELARHGNNSRALQNIATWIEANPGPCRGLHPTQVRILDIIAWMAVKYNQFHLLES